ncbi:MULTISPECIES: phosphoglucosamine mutase [unclassified Desulfovibrio]|uniref:phosphoglucosamine mutase n=1 Tax=unclassified Desulfovibrio TaxID=2593640 RepID=UPI000F5DEA95|nr:MULTISPECIES: phosphoglucosamine mutase [unclassified Desulfovibrio]RRD71092.1 phosphoglucosamine mutase [Desulfovibrio sp. OH1209_COT-279]RRD87434.1 phosphoglucosamine mutase [Desulfovibrio sp. OH1186_COT-070]
MADRLFGTDGLRGKVNNSPMTAGMVLRLGLAAGVRFRRGQHQHRVVIGKDTRLSGYMFESALTAGLCAAGMHVIMTGPLPTPAISFLTRNMRADLGVVISASHNPFDDNGIKFFDANGYKLPDETEDEISAMVLDRDFSWPYPDARHVGRATKIEDAGGRYIVYTKSSFPAHLTLAGLRIVVDCGNGASYKVAPLALEELGAEVFRIGTSPDGTNINEHCGSLYPEVVAAKVREVRADVGLALDGDADRLVMVDERGTILDGDQLMAMCAQALMARGELPGNILVATAMSNMALEIFMQEHGGVLLRTKVGDRYVMEAMRREGAMLGGEQSGHLVFHQYSTTGDGLLAALQVLKIMCEKEKPLSELAGLLIPFPQKLINVRIKNRLPFEERPAIGDAVQKVEAALAGRGRVLLRYSGTESLCRVMVEGEHPDKVQEYAEELAAIVARELA